MQSQPNPYRNIHFMTATNVYQVAVRHGDYNQHVGIYPSLKAAMDARDDAEIQKEVYGK